MLYGYIVIILLILCCIGFGVLLGWTIWGRKMKYYKYLSIHYKHLCQNYNIIPDYLEEYSKDPVDPVDYIEDPDE